MSTNPLYYVKAGAVIYFDSDNFYFKIRGSLSLFNILILGTDMHTFGIPCIQKPYPSLCSCLDESNLLDETSVCSIKKTYVPKNDNIYKGFIQLGNFLIFFNFICYNWFIYFICFMFRFLGEFRLGWGCVCCISL